MANNNIHMFFLKHLLSFTLGSQNQNSKKLLKIKLILFAFILKTSFSGNVPPRIVGPIFPAKAVGAVLGLGLWSEKYLSITILHSDNFRGYAFWSMPLF